MTCWWLEPLDETSQRDLLAVIDDQFNRQSTIAIGQPRITHWHKYLRHATLADPPA